MKPSQRLNLSKIILVLNSFFSVNNYDLCANNSCETNFGIKKNDTSLYKNNYGDQGQICLTINQPNAPGYYGSKQDFVSLCTFSGTRHKIREQIHVGVQWYKDPNNTQKEPVVLSYYYTTENTDPNYVSNIVKTLGMQQLGNKTDSSPNFFCDSFWNPDRKPCSQEFVSPYGSFLFNTPTDCQSMNSIVQGLPYTNCPNQKGCNSSFLLRLLGFAGAAPKISTFCDNNRLNLSCFDDKEILYNFFYDQEIVSAVGKRATPINPFWQYTYVSAIPQNYWKFNQCIAPQGIFTYFPQVVKPDCIGNKRSDNDFDCVFVNQQGEEISHGCPKDSGIDILLIDIEYELIKKQDNCDCISETNLKPPLPNCGVKWEGKNMNSTIYGLSGKDTDSINGLFEKLGMTTFCKNKTDFYYREPQVWDSLPIATQDINVACGQGRICDGAIFNGRCIKPDNYFSDTSGCTTVNRNFVGTKTVLSTQGCGMTHSYCIQNNLSSKSTSCPAPFTNACYGAPFSPQCMGCSVFSIAGSVMSPDVCPAKKPFCIAQNKIGSTCYAPKNDLAGCVTQSKYDPNYWPKLQSIGIATPVINNSKEGVCDELCIGNSEFIPYQNRTVMIKCKAKCDSNNFSAECGGCVSDQTGIIVPHLCTGSCVGDLKDIDGNKIFDPMLYNQALSCSVTNNFVSGGCRNENIRGLCTASAFCQQSAGKIFCCSQDNTNWTTQCLPPCANKTLALSVNIDCAGCETTSSNVTNGNNMCMEDESCYGVLSVNPQVYVNQTDKSLGCSKPTCQQPNNKCNNELCIVNTNQTSFSVADLITCGKNLKCSGYINNYQCKNRVCGSCAGCVDSNLPIPGLDNSALSKAICGTQEACAGILTDNDCVALNQQQNQQPEDFEGCVSFDSLKISPLPLGQLIQHNKRGLGISIPHICNGVCFGEMRDQSDQVVQSPYDSKKCIPKCISTIDNMNSKCVESIWVDQNQYPKENFPEILSLCGKNFSFFMKNIGEQNSLLNSPDLNLSMENNFCFNPINSNCYSSDGGGCKIDPNICSGRSPFYCVSGTSIEKEVGIGVFIGAAAVFILSTVFSTIFYFKKNKIFFNLGVGLTLFSEIMSLVGFCLMAASYLNR